jgi:hypothetical protein
MSEEERPSEAEETDGDAELDLLPEEAGEVAEDAGDGLEIDDRQSEEIRSIFGTTLPQYLEPVEEMVQQILTDTPARDTIDALLGTLSSLGQAASRVGFEEVVVQLDRFRETITGLGEELEGPVSREEREAILGGLIDLKDLAQQICGPIGAVAEGERGATVFQALKEVEGLGDAVLQKLSAAGLTRVDQLREARPDEIAAVTGLEPEVVQQLLLHVGAPLPSSDDGAAIEELPLGPGSLEKVLQNRLKQQVEAETAVEEVRAEVQRLRAAVSRQRAALRSSRRKRDELAEELSRTADRRDGREARLEKVLAERAELARRSVEMAEQLRRQEARLMELRQRRQRLARQDTEFGEDLEQLMTRVRGVLERGARRIEARSAAPPTHRGVVDKSNR